MLFFHLKSSLPIIKTTMASALLIGTVQLIVGCDSRPSSSNNDVTAQTNNIVKETRIRYSVSYGLLKRLPTDDTHQA